MLTQIPLTGFGFLDETYVFRKNVIITSYSTVVSEWSAIQESDDDEEDKGKGKKGKAKSGKGGVLFEGGEFKFHRSGSCVSFSLSFVLSS